MLWFSFRKKLFNSVGVESVKLAPVYEGDRGLANLYGNDAELRVWIPEPLKLAMEEVSNRLEKTVSEYLRDFFVVYLYGSHELICMVENQTGVFYTPPPKPSAEELEHSEVFFSRSRSVDFIPGLGKNIVPLKLFLHEKLKTDLQTIADQTSLPLSRFVRELMVSHFLGHTVWPERKQLFSPEQVKVAIEWENGGVNYERIRSPNYEEEEALVGKIETLHL